MSFRKALTVGALCLSASVLPYASAFALEGNALPSGGTVVGGSAGFDYSTPNELHIQQSSDRAVINWDSFNIGKNALTQFHQNSSSAIAVNRVTGSGVDPTQILGTLKANGRIIVLDRNGVIFGRDSIVDVGGIVASTGTIDDAAFMRGDHTVKITGADKGEIVLNGQMTIADAGLAAFVAPTVINNGIVTAKMGRVELAGATSATVDLYGDGLTEVAVDADQAKTFVSNTGLIDASGGTVKMTAAAAKKIVDATINMSGVIRVGSVTQKGGKIILSAEGGNAVKNNIKADKGKKTGHSTVLVDGGYLDASGYGDGQTGGAIEITGDAVGVYGSLIDASGDAGGGSIKIGGDYLGTGTTAASLLTIVDQHSLILNNAVHSGDGGRTIVWSDGNTGFYGSILARGGQASGNGGFVETSGHKYLDAQGYVDLTADHGDKGTYLLDPANITIYGNVDPTFQSTDGTLNLGANLRLWFDAADTAKVVLTYNNMSANASGTIGANTITVSNSTGLVVGARIRLGATGTAAAASTIGADTYTIASISGTTVTLSSNLTSTYAAVALNQGYVSQWTDKSGLNNNVTQSSAGSMPLWISNGQNNGSSILFSNSALSATLNLLGGSNDLSVFVNATPGSAQPTYSDILDYSHPSGGFTIQQQDNQINRYSFAYQSGGGYPGYTVADSVQLTSLQPQLLSYIKDNTTLSGYLNSQTIFSDATVTSSINGSNSSLAFSIGAFTGGGRNFNGQITDLILYNDNLSSIGRNLVEQYQSAKSNIALDPNSGTALSEAAEAMDSSTGYSVFTTRYLERLSQTANISLVASNDINFDLKGDMLNLASNRDFTLNAGNNIASLSSGTVRTNGSGSIAMIAGGTIDTSGLNVNAAGSGSIAFTANGLALGGAVTGGGASVLTIKPYTASTSIGLSGGTGALNLDDAELGYISGFNKLIIGDAASGTGDILIDSWDLSGKTYGVELYGNDITFQDTDATAGVDYSVKLGTGNFKAYARDNGVDVGTLAVNAQFVKSIAGTSSLDLYADRDIVFTSANIDTSTGLLNVQLNSDRNADSDGAITLTNATINSNGGTVNLLTSGTTGITATNSTLNGGSGAVNLTAGGAVSYTSPNSFTVNTVSGSSVLLQTTGTAKSITTDGQITATGVGNAAVVAATGSFINGYGASLFNMSGGGRWLVYSTNPSLNIRNGLTPNAAAIYGGTYATMAPGGVAAGNRLIFSDAVGSAPAITFTADNKSKTYGDANGPLTYSVGGYIDADNASTAFTGGVTLATLIDQTSNAGAHTDEIVVSNNGLATNLGYRFVFDNGDYQIDRANLTVTANSFNKTYGSAYTFAGNEFSQSGLLNSDTISSVSLTSAGAAGTATVAGGPYAIAVSAAAGTGLGNYNISYIGGALAVDRANLTVTANSFNKTYGSAYTFAGNEFSNGTLYNGDTISSVTLASAGAAATATVAGGPYAINASAATGTGLGNYNISYTGGALTVDRANLLISANDAAKTYGAVKTFAGTEFAHSTLYNGDTISGASISSAGAASNANVAGGPYTIAVSAATGAGLGNYNIIYTGGQLTVNRANLIVSANSFNKTYGSTYTFAGNEFSQSGLLNSDMISGVTLTSAGSAGTATVAGGPYAINASAATGTGLGNYNISYTGGQLTVDRANLSVVANSFHKTYGSVYNFAGNEYINSTLYNGDTITGLTLTSGGAAGTATVAGGPYTINASAATGTGLGNYNINYTNGTLTVDRANLLISANSDTKTYGSTKTFAGTEFNTSTLYNGDTVTGATITSVGAAATANVAGGPYVIAISNATGTGLDNYNISYANGSLVVNKANLLITANDATKTYGSGYTFTGNEYTHSTLYNSDMITSVTLASSGTVSNAGASNYNIIASNAAGTGLDNYNITYNAGHLLVDKSTLTIVANSFGKIYGSAYSFAGNEFASTGLVNSDSISGVTLTSAGAAATAAASTTPYTIVIGTATGSGLGNYNIVYQNGALTVDRANLTIIADSAHKNYGSTKTFAGSEFIHSALYNGDTITGISLSSAGAASSATVADGPYTINASGAYGTGLGNYNITYTSGALTVDRANLIISANNLTKPAGSVLNFTGTEFTNSTLYNNDAITHVNFVSAGADVLAAPGGYTISASGATGTGLGNYTISYNNGSLNVISVYVPPVPTEPSPAATLPLDYQPIINQAANLSDSNPALNSDTQSQQENIQKHGIKDTVGCMVINDISGGCAVQ